MVVASSGQVSTKLGEDAVILGVASGKYFGLNPVGARVWELVQERTRVSAVCDAVLAEYDVERAQCETDVLEVLHALADRGLLDVAEDG